MIRFKASWLIAVAAVGALATVSAAFAAGGSSSGGGGGGGGGGGTTTTPVPAGCGGLTVTVSPSAVAPYYQVSGKTSTACDGMPVEIAFEDVTGPADSCTVSLPSFFGATYFKYGVRPPSRYQSSVFTEPLDCLGTSRVMQATLRDRNTGAVYGVATTTWVP